MVNWRPSTLSDSTKPKHNEARFWRSSDCKRRRKDYEIAEPWQTRDLQIGAFTGPRGDRRKAIDEINKTTSYTF